VWLGSSALIGECGVGHLTVVVQRGGVASTSNACRVGLNRGGGRGPRRRSQAGAPGHRASGAEGRRRSSQRCGGQTERLSGWV
jgi:hypothetical protein